MSLYILQHSYKYVVLAVLARREAKQTIYDLKQSKSRGSQTARSINVLFRGSQLGHLQELDSSSMILWGPYYCDDDDDDYYCHDY